MQVAERRTNRRRRSAATYHDTDQRRQPSSPEPHKRGREAGEQKGQRGAECHRMEPKGQAEAVLLAGQQPDAQEGGRRKHGGRERQEEARHVVAAPGLAAAAAMEQERWLGDKDDPEHRQGTPCGAGEGIAHALPGMPER